MIWPITRTETKHPDADGVKMNLTKEDSEDNAGRGTPSLRALLREAFVRLGDEPATEREQAEADFRTSRIRRSAEDRSRTRQMVIKELTRRKEARGESIAATV